MSAHTPGPWMAEVVKSNGGGWKAETQHVQVTANNGRMLIADYDTSYAEYPADEVNEANARLFAAAPRLLAALESYVLAVAVGGGDDKASVMAAIRTADNEARAAIAAAKGQS